MIGKRILFIFLALIGLILFMSILSIFLDANAYQKMPPNFLSSVLLGYGVILLIAVFATKNMAIRRNRTKNGWMLLSFIFPFIAPFVLACLPKARFKERISPGYQSNNTNRQIEQEFFDLWETTVFETTAKLLSSGQPTDNEAITKTAVNRASEVIMNKYSLSTSQMVAIIERAFDSHK